MLGADELSCVAGRNVREFAAFKTPADFSSSSIASLLPLHYVVYHCFYAEFRRMCDHFADGELRETDAEGG